MQVKVYLGDGYCLKLQTILLHGHCELLFAVRATISDASVAGIFILNFQYNAIVPLIDNRIKRRPELCSLGNCTMQVYAVDQYYELYQSDQQINVKSTNIKVVNRWSINDMYDYSWSLRIHYELRRVPVCVAEQVNNTSPIYNAAKSCGQIIIEKRTKPFTFLIEGFVGQKKIIIGLQKLPSCKGI